MVERQLAARNIDHARVLEAMAKVPRDRFMTPQTRHQAYEDMAVPIGSGQTISQPYMVALMTQELHLDGPERVLEIGTGSGYQTAILAELCDELFTVERIALLSQRSRGLLDQLGYQNVHYRVGDGTLGWPEAAPVDRILVTAAGPDIPESLQQQLDVGGILVMPVSRGDHEMLVRAERSPAGIVTHDVCRCAFVRLIGEEGWSEGR